MIENITLNYLQNYAIMRDKRKTIVRRFGREIQWWGPTVVDASEAPKASNYCVRKADKSQSSFDYNSHLLLLHLLD